MASIFDGSGYDATKLQTLLTQAQEAYHALVTGTKAVTIERNGRKVIYTVTNIQDLRLYIQDLQVSLTPTSGRQRTPARMLF